MPARLVERINTSLAAEQAQRAATISNASVTPPLATAQRAPARLLLTIAGAAAVVVLAAVVGITIFTVRQPDAISGRTIVANAAEPSGQEPPGLAIKDPGLAGGTTTPSLVQIGLSGTRYTLADFETQALALRRSPPQPMAAKESSVGPIGTTSGLIACLTAIGATGAQVVRADVAFYEGQPAVIIVTTTNGIPMAYAVGRRCSPTDATVVHAAIRLP